MTFDYKEDWCNDCMYVNDKNRESMCIRNCHKGNQKVVYEEEDFKTGRQIMPAKEDLKGRLSDMSEYWVTKNGTHQIKGDPLELGVRIVDKIIWNITEVTNVVNGTFYWHNNDGTTYPTSILVANGKTYQNIANHWWDSHKPQSVIVVYKNGKVDMRRIVNSTELGDINNIHVAIGGVGLVNKTDPNFKYSLNDEGFIGIYADVGRKANKTVLGYNIKEDKMYLMTRANIYHKSPYFWQYDLLKLVRDCEYDLAISLDGGGSTFMDANWRYVFKGEANRRINNVVGFGI